MKFTEREKIVVLLLPLAIVLGAYAWWYDIFQRPKSLAVEQTYQAALTAQPTPSDKLVQQSRKKLLDREVEELQKQKADLDGQAAVAAGREVDPRRRIEKEKLLGALLRKHGLEVVDEGPAADANQAKLPASVVEALGRFGQPSTQPIAQVRRLRLAGTFIDVLAAVGELAAMEVPPGVPISLSMAEADVQDPQRNWTLLVWM